MTPPVLYLIFNRPDLMEQSFAPIRNARPAQLFIAADGPRPDREGEEERCAEARSIVEKVDWPCEVHTLFRDENFGCRRAVSEAITWFFTHVEEGIILEDDCVPDATFFAFCAELLERYRNDERIMVISGDNHQQGISRTNASYYFSKYPHCWGWATWRKAWKYYDDDMGGWQQIKDTRRFCKWFHSKQERKYWEKRFEDSFLYKLDSWATVWVFTCWWKNGLTILPNINLVENIGWGGDATHTFGQPIGLSFTKQSVSFPLAHPVQVSASNEADKYTDEAIFSEYCYSLKNRLLRLKWRIGAWRRKHCRRSGAS